jgi:hypothetical protein
MLTGESLVPSEDGTPPPAPSSVRPVDPQLSAIVIRAMAKAPADRFSSAQAMRLLLTSATASLSPEGTGSVATGLARSLTMAFRDRMLAFQEQIDLWRKFEDEALPDAEERGRRPEFSGTSSSGMHPAGRRTGMTGSNPAYFSQPGVVSGMGPGFGPGFGSISQRGNSLSGQAQVSTPLPRNTPLPSSPPPESPWKGRIFFALLFCALLGILVGSVLVIMRPRGSSRDAVLMVDSQPRGAQILVDGRPAGNTPHRVSELGAAPVRIEVRKEGYRPFVLVVTPEPGKTKDVEANLEEDRGPR